MKVSDEYLPCDCGGRAVRQSAPAEVAIGAKTQTFQNIPAFVCEKCGEIYYDGPSIVRIEKQLERKTVLA